MHTSFKITGGCQCGEQMWCSRSFTSPTASFRMTRRSLVYGDKRQASSMVTRNVFLSEAKNLEKKGRTTDHEHDIFVFI